MGFTDLMTGARVLVTGATGFVGRHILGPLQALGCEVHVISRRPANHDSRGVRYHECDLHNHAGVASLMGAIRPEHLLHLAWDVTPGEYITSLENLRWVQSTLALAHIFVECGGRRIVGAGTAAEYSWHKSPCDEATTPLVPDSLYAGSKLALWHVLDRLSAQGSVGFAWGRVFFMFGPHEAPERLVPVMVDAARRQQSLTLRHPTQVRDYLHAADVGAAFVALLASDVQGAVNLASGEGTDLSALAGLVGEAAGTEVPLELGSTLDDPHPVVVAEVTRLREEVRFTPRFSLRSGLRDTVDWWFRQHGNAGT
jgi:UDP-glucuronate decarboxylase